MTENTEEKTPADQFTTAQIAAYFKVKVGTVRSWVNDGCPAERRGKGKPVHYNLEKVKAWKRLSASAGADLDPQREKAMLDRERRFKVSAERKLMEGKLVRVSDVEDLWGMMIGSARAKLLSLPIKLAPVVLACGSLAEIEDETRRLIHEALSELADSGVPDDGSMEAAAESDGEPVGGPIPETEPGSLSGAGAVADESSTVPEGDTGRAE